MDCFIFDGMQYMLHGGNGSLGEETCRGMRFYVHSLFTRPSGGPIFLCLKKDIEERHAKGLQSRPLDSGFLYGGLEGRRA